MKSEYNNFIGTYTNVYPEGFCSHIINEFERLCSMGAGSKRVDDPKHRKDDYQIELNLPVEYENLSLTLGSEPIRSFKDVYPVDMFCEGLQKCFDDYVDEYSVLKPLNIRGSYIKAQRTDPGQGYHLWHSEKGDSFEAASRSLVYCLYLNTLEPHEGGETEFFYSRKRILPVENTMIIWPAGFTHAHRGNMVLGDRSKYIITGWFNHNVK